MIYPAVISDTRPVFDLFPNLHALKFMLYNDEQSGYGLSVCAALFMHPGLKNLHIKCKSRTYPIFTFMIPSRRLQDLTSFVINGDVENFQDLIAVLVDLPNLKNLTLRGPGSR